MKFKILWISLIIIVLSFPSICFSEQPDSKVWEYFSDNWYYNKTNITKSSNIISVWTYEIPTDDGRKEIIESFKAVSSQLSTKFQNYDHNTELLEIECKKRQVRGTQLLFYDGKGNVFHSIQVQGVGKWEKIRPGSVFDKLYQKLCVTQKKPMKKK